MAALASAAMPGMVVSGVREAGQPRPADAANGISQATVQDAVGKLYDVYVTDTEAGRKALAARVHAADTLSQTRELGGLGFVLDRVVAFERGGNDRGPTAGAAVMITSHPTGTARPLSMLTIDDCTAMGTAIGAIHRLNGAFLAEHDYPAFTTGQIRAQLTAWIKRLRAAGHIPGEITASWARVLETEGLWSFTTCPVHGGFDNGDVLFSGSTITAITNWQDMQINDPARDLAWIFAKLDETHRNAVLAAYGRMLGNRLDDLIMLRANLWLQMEQVGDFVQALSQADNARILQFKAQVERLAHQLGVATQRAKAAAPASKPATGAKPPSTITVSTLLNDAERHGAASHAGGESPAPANADEADNTGEMDRTGSAQITTFGTADPDSTADRPVTPHSHPATSPTAVFGAPSDAIHVAESGDTDEPDNAGESDDTNEHTDVTAAQPSGESTATIVIPRLEREEQAMRDARAGIDGADDNDDTDERTPQA
ncbi:phosphotransferase [Bifidobacterium pullorum]|uniref:phosphotransferase n=1 Tax=Bifidobacterium pullorum TaxID=78448 RepID=UPI00242D6FBE|nr:phosphotransferase [Bifidobacterium pullorum]